MDHILAGIRPEDLATTQGQPVRYTLLNLPHYLCPFAGDILAGISGRPA